MGDWDKEAVKELRGAVYRGDSVVELVRGRLTDDVLQLAGDGLLHAVAQGIPGAHELAAQCAAALRDRLWWGDEELADQLEAAVGQGAMPLLRTLPIDLRRAGVVPRRRSALRRSPHRPQDGPGVAARPGLRHRRRCGRRGRRGPLALRREPRLTRRLPRHGAVHRHGERSRNRRPSSRSRSPAKAPSAGSRTYLPAGPRNWRVTSCCAKSVSADGPERGWPAKAIDRPSDQGSPEHHALAATML